ncbi:MAG: hypothetical protein ACODAD_08300, partial [Planctomycetota bacterium]
EASLSRLATGRSSSVSKDQIRAPLLDTFYELYLSEETSARFVARVSGHYLTGTLARLAVCGARTTRRAAVLAVGFLGNYECNGVLGHALRDEDRVVRLLAENSIRELWLRDGAPEHQHRARHLVRLNDCGRFDEAVREASQLTGEADGFAEVWNQRAVAYFQLSEYRKSLSDCKQTICRNPFHFPCAIGMGHCYLELHEPSAALECFRWALEVNPDLENVRVQVNYLQRALEGH